MADTYKTFCNYIKENDIISENDHIIIGADEKSNRIAGIGFSAGASQIVISPGSGRVVVFDIHNSTVLNSVKEFSEGAITLRCAYVDGDLFVGDDKLATLDKLKSKNELIADVVLSLYGGINNVMLSLSSGKNKICGIIETLKKK